MINSKTVMPKGEAMLFLLLVIGLALLFEYNHILFMPPQSVHDWRQADCASFAMTYYQHGMHFFEPKVYNMLLSDGNAVGEFPVLYYLVAILYKLFGPHLFLFRLTFTLIFVSGLFSLFSVVKQLTGSSFYSFLLPLLLFSSPLIMFFANNFLCDVSALSFALAGFSRILKYRSGQRMRDFWWSMFFFTLAALLKLNSAICFIGVMGMFCIEFAGWARFGKENNRMFMHGGKNIMGFAAALLLIVAWYSWAIYYNDSHNTSFLGTKTWPGWPIWEASSGDLLSTFTALFRYSAEIFAFATSFLLPVLFLFILLNRKALDPFIYGVLLVASLGVALFIFIFFVGIRDNIYYCVNLMLLPVLVFIASLMIVKEKYRPVFESVYLKAALVVLLLLNVIHVREKLRDFYHDGKEHYQAKKTFYHPEFRNFIDNKIGIGVDDKVISYPDQTPDVTLNFIERQGWSGYNGPADTAAVSNNIRKGAKYLILCDLTILGNPGMSAFSGDFAGNFWEMYVYRLPSAQNIKPWKDSSFTVRVKDHFIGPGAGEKKYLSAQTDSASSEVYTLVRLYGDRYAIKTKEGTYWSADFSAGGELTASTRWIANWESFHLVPKGNNKFVLKGYNEKFLCIPAGNGGQISCTADVPGQAEVFEFIYRK
jgi:hypothetical protein